MCHLHSHKQLLRILISPYSCQHFLLSVILIIAILMGMKWYLIIVLVFISLMVNEVEHLFIGLLVICISSQEKYLVKPLAHFNQSICLFCCCFYHWFVRVLSIYSRCKSLIKYIISKYFSHFMNYLSIFLMVSFIAQVLNCDKVKLSLVAYIHGVISKKPLPNLNSRFIYVFYKKFYIFYSYI